MVYIYRKYDTEKIDRNLKRMAVAGGLVFIGFFFGFLESKIGYYDASISLTGLSFLEVARESAGGNGFVKAVFMLPLVSSVMGLALLCVSVLNLRGYEIRVPYKVLMICSIVMALAPVILFALLMFSSTQSSGFGIMGMLLESESKMYPGAGIILQIAGGIIAAISAKSNMELDY